MPSSHHCGAVDARGDGVGVLQVRPERCEVGVKAVLKARDPDHAITTLACDSVKWRGNGQQ